MVNSKWIEKKRIPIHHLVYILQSADGRYYTGYTTDLARRMKAHRTGKGAKFTRAFGVATLLYSEALPSKSLALKREAEIKGWSRAKKAALINERPALRPAPMSARKTATR